MINHTEKIDFATALRYCQTGLATVQDRGNTRMSDDQDTVTEVTETGWGDRILSSLKGAVAGLLMVPLAMALLSWNEDRAADRQTALASAAREVIPVAADRIDSRTEGRLIHVSGRASPAGRLEDPDFPVTVSALRLIRRTEMYQWREVTTTETRDKLGGGSETITTTRYEKDWSEDLIDSASFRKPDGHANPDWMPFPSHTETADRVLLGAFRLTPAQIDALTDEQPVTVRDLPADIDGIPVHVSGHEVFIGANPARPETGDLRIRFTQTPAADVSVVARQAGSSFAPYATPTGTVDLVRYGLLPPDAVIHAAQRENTLLTWGLRLAGALLIFIGFRLLFSPLEALAYVLPPLGWLSGAILSLLAGGLTLVLTLGTIGTAWITRHPLAAVAVGLSLPAAVLLWRRLRRQPA